MLRGLMALAVAFYHFTIWYPVFTPGRFMAYTAAKAGHYGVEGFFIISGFCFFHIYRPGQLPGRRAGAIPPQAVPAHRAAVLPGRG